jgi:hypothetical protein|tara:strand:- start:108 stop:395 length:288 start_codon:yes stop_codon:yes gene_type:complete
MNDVKHLPLWQKDAKKLMRKIYMIYAKYGIYAVEGQRADAYHDHMLYSYERAKSLYENPDEYPMDEVCESLRVELKYIGHFAKIHTLLATIPSLL